MKSAACAVLVVLASAGVMAQTALLKPVPKSNSGKLLHREIRVLAAEVRAPLTPAELEVARRVHVGTLPCELGQVVLITPDPASSGYFFLRMGKGDYHLAPEETTTGAIRLEDKVAGIVWLQLANKSMLMSQKLGQRLADECQSPLQVQVAKALLVNPQPNLLEAVSKADAPQVKVD
jgi:hypothetical protein